jgi:hypothetical protein
MNDSFWAKDCHRFETLAKETSKQTMERISTEDKNDDRKRRVDNSNQSSDIPALQKRRQETI